MDVAGLRETEERLDDPEAFRAFYEYALPRVFGYFYHRCGGSFGVAEELTQETFLGAVASIRKGEAIAAPLPWVLGIARHKLLDHYRRQARAGGGPALRWEKSTETGDADAWAAPREDEGWRERTLTALAAVPVAQREALVLRYLDGLSVPEVAATLGRSVHAVESLLVRGKASFKRCYAEANDE